VTDVKIDKQRRIMENLPLKKQKIPSLIVTSIRDEIYYITRGATLVGSNEPT